MVDLLIVFNHIAFRENTLNESSSIKNTAGGTLNVEPTVLSRTDIIESARSFDANGNRQIEWDVFAVYINGALPIFWDLRPIETDSSLTPVIRNTINPTTDNGLGTTLLPVSVGNSDTRKYLVFNPTNSAGGSPTFNIISQRIQISTPRQSAIIGETGETTFEGSGAVKLSSEANLRTYDIFYLTV